MIFLRKLNALGGVHTQDDFDAAAANYVTPIKTNFGAMISGECLSERTGCTGVDVAKYCLWYR